MLQDNYLGKIFLYLTSLRISDAVKLAQQHQDYRMSLLLSQAEGTAIVRKWLCNQLLSWEQNGVCSFFQSHFFISFLFITFVFFIYILYLCFDGCLLCEYILGLYQKFYFLLFVDKHTWIRMFCVLADFFFFFKITSKFLLFPFLCSYSHSFLLCTIYYFAITIVNQIIKS